MRDTTHDCTIQRKLDPADSLLGHNPISLIGVGLTTASALTLIGFWVISVFGHGGSANPYLGITLDLCLPALFILGLILVPIGIWWRRHQLKATGELPTGYPKIDNQRTNSLDLVGFYESL